MRTSPTPTMSDPDLQDAGQLFTRCHDRYGLTPEEVLGLLAFRDVDALKAGVGSGCTFHNYARVFEKIGRSLTLSSGRILEPRTDHRNLLIEALDEAEAKAWASLKGYRLQAFGHWSEIWASLARIMGDNRRNPFGAIVSLGRREERRRAAERQSE